MDQPAWLTHAWADLGVREKPGPAREARIVGYFRDAGQDTITRDEVAWCAAFVGAMLKRSGMKGTGSLLARSYLACGQELAQPRAGAICVLKRGSEPWMGHVGFVVGTAPGTVLLLGGNQANTVSVAAYATSRVLGYRWPDPAAQPEGPTTLPRSADSGAHETGSIQQDHLPPRGDAVAGEKDDQAFAAALAHVLEMEGGYSDDPYDPGGPTNKGITLGVYARFINESVDATSRSRLVASLKRIPDELVAKIYAQRYWQPARCEKLPVPVGLFHFDAAVNHGVARAARLLQAALDVSVDGAIGPRTLAAAHGQPVENILARYAQIRRAHYRSLPHFWRFGRGWLRRVDATLAVARQAATRISRAQDAMSKGANDMNTETQDAGKWWLQSKTMWGAFISALASVLPMIGPMIGVDLPGEVVRQAGDQTLVAVQAVAGLIGTLLTIYGRLTARSPLMRRPLNVRV